MRIQSRVLAFVLFALRSPLRLGYRVAIRLVASYLRRGLAGMSVYVAGSCASREIVPGLSDIDLVVVTWETATGDQHEREVLLGRWGRLRHFIGTLARGIGIAIYAEPKLADTATVLTYGLDGEHGCDDKRGGYLRPGRPVDDLYRRMHPGLYGPGRTWRLVAGGARMPTEPLGSPRYRSTAAWLELQWWWRFAFELCTCTNRSLASYLAFKLTAEPARIWLWLADGDRVDGRREALRRAVVLLPDEEAPLRSALELHERLPRAAAPPLHDTLAWLLRIGDRIAELLETELRPHGSREVRLVGGGVTLDRESSEAAKAISRNFGASSSIPLADWRARAMPRCTDEALLSIDVEAADPVAIGALARYQSPGLQPVVRSGRLLTLPGDAFSDRVLLRSVQFSGFDPVSFALLESHATAAFAEVPGLCVHDCARRAVNEHAVWLSRWLPAEPRTEVALGLLLTAARAALFWESVAAGEPQLLLSASETVTHLGLRDGRVRSVAEDALAAFIDHRAGGAAPPVEVVKSFRGVVENFACYRAPT